MSDPIAAGALHPSVRASVHPAVHSTRWTRRGAVRSASLLIAFLIIVSAIVPWWPEMPASALDPSWAMGMNQARVQRLVAGTDIVFTFGPYAMLGTAMYHPQTDTAMMLGCAFLAAAYCLCFARFMRDRDVRAAVLPVIVLLCVSTRDALILSYPLLLGLTVLSPRGLAGARALRVSEACLLFVLCLPLGLLPLIKGTFGIASVATLVVMAAWFVGRRAFLAAAITVSASFVALLVFWVVSGSPVAALLPYFANLRFIVGGYGDAMALSGPFTEVVAVGLAALLVLGLSLFERSQMRTTAFVGVFCAAFVGLAFKAGLIRHDDVHLFIALDLLALLASFRFVQTKSRALAGALAGTLILSVVLHARYPMSGVTEPFRRTTSLARGIVARLHGTAVLDARYRQAMARVRDESPLPALSGTTDTYPIEQAALFASNNRWAPRPVFQSYSAYTPELLEMNRRHLSGKSAPDNVFFSIDPMDDRLPSLDDSTSWPILLRSYVSTGRSGERLVLRRKGAAADLPDLSYDRVIEGTLQTSFAVPAGQGPIFARVDMKPTWLGRMASLAFKPPMLWIETRQANGKLRVFRFVPGIGQAGFLVSPLVTDIAQFSRLQSGDPLRDREVVSFRIIAGTGGRWLWDPTVSASFADL